MIGRCGYILVVFLFCCKICHGRVVVSLTIDSYSNPNGTAYLDTTSSRKCCDGPQRASCQTGDTCDTFFNICVGIYGPNGCNGAKIVSQTFNNTNTITNVTLSLTKGDTWPAGASIFVFITDDDSDILKRNDQIDTLIQELKFFPAADRSSSTSHTISWAGKTSLQVSVSAWCDTDYYSQDCSVYCLGLTPMAWCSTTGQLTCSYTDEVLIELNQTTTQADFPQLDRGLHRFVKEQVCHNSNSSTVNYPSLQTSSNTLVFSSTCKSRDVTALQLESLLNEKTDALLNLYFPPGVVRGKNRSLKDYGEHIVPNVYIGIEIVSVEHPLGTSFNGAKTSGKRRCCDVPSTRGCQTVTDKCDMQFYICVGRLVNGVCVGAVTISKVYQDTTSLLTCGPALLDHSQGKAYVSHPMLGAMRLTAKTAEIQVIVKDSDLGGNSSDVIDVLGGIVSIIPGSDVTNASSEVLALKNVVSLKLSLLFWCAPGHSGPLCKANNGTDHCAAGWHGDDCSIATTACSSSPCLNHATCIPNNDGTFKCVCTEGYNGTVCDKDVDECALNVCQNGATCQNSPGAFQCNCPSGWDGLLCTDKVPQCNPSPCDFGICEPHAVAGSNTNFSCKCWPTWAGKYCSVKAMCSQGSCIHGDCTASSGGDLFCICDQGYKGINCSLDINECEAKPCKNGGTCVNNIGDFTCTCPSGFTGKLCNEIVVTCPSSQCSNHGNCTAVSNGQGHACSCFAGYTGDSCELSTNYCSNVSCEHGGVCTELSNDFMCKCPKYWSGKTCDVDVNECSNNPCKNNGTCQNSLGSFSCTCQTGWNGNTCTDDVNECLTSPCKHGTCTNTQGSYKCVCKSGFYGSNCSNKSIFCNATSCSGHGFCHEQATGYNCTCSSGYTGQHCEIDIDECSSGVCKNNAISCTNSHGSYNCTCAQGWTGNTCETDINECQLLTPVPCSVNGICHNTKGSFNCACFPGFVGKTCDVIVDDCDSLKCLNNGSCKTGNDGPKCVCSAGWQGIRCETDKDECELSEVCAPNGDCVNTDGAYYCNCYSGWTGNKCKTDVNECLTSACSNDGVCSNSIGTFACSCKQGWEGIHCEVESTTSLTGSVNEFIFGQNVSSSQINLVVSRVFQFLSTYTCKGKHILLQVAPLISNRLRFKASCSGSAVTKAAIDTGLLAVPNVTKAYLFPLTLQQVSSQQIDPNTKSWISSNWPVIVGVVVAVIIIASVTFGYLRERKKKSNTTEAFANPTFSETDYQSAGDYS